MGSNEENMFNCSLVSKNNLEYILATGKDFICEEYDIKQKDSEKFEDSEKSYDLKSQTETNNFIFLSFSYLWTFIVTISAIGLFAIVSYREVFDKKFVKEEIFAILFYLCFATIIITDTISSTAHYIYRSMSCLKVYKRKHFIILYVDLICLVLLPIGIKNYFSQHSRFWSKVELILTIITMHRAAEYFYTVTSSPTRKGLMYVLIKYGILILIVIHSHTCIWKEIGCLECRNTYVKHWTDEFHNKKMSPEALFGYCTYSSIAATATSIGILGASKRNDVEFLICIVVMLFNLFIMNGVFLGAFTSVQIDGYRRRTLFGTRLNLILQQVDHRNVSKKLAKKIRTWYYNFWMKESAIHKLEASDLLPESMINDIELDKYWHTLNQSLILRHVSDGMKRALAQKMETYYYSKGDVIVYQDQLQNKIIFVATGVVQVVAPDDIESPIINLGYGSCIGESYMLLNIPNAAHMIASTYCKVHALDKRAVWRTVVQYKKMNESRNMFNVINILIANSHELHAVKQKQLQLSRKRVDKTLKLIKQVLRSSFEDIQTDKTDLKTTDLYIINKIEGSTKHKDMIFVTTNWPWILYPNSQLLQIWNGLIFIISVAVAIVYPYVLFYLKTSPPFYDVFLRPVANILFIADVIVQIFTAVEDDKQNMNSTLSGIISKRFTQLNFLIDVASIIPIEILYKGILTYDRRNNIFDCNHMLKIIRIVSFFVNLTKSFKFGTNVTRIFLYVVYLTYLGYLQGLFYYLAGCSSRPCKSPSWVIMYKEKMKPDVNIDDDTNTDILFVSFLYGLLLLTGTGGRIFITNTWEMVLATIYFVTFIFLYTYLLADYSATLTLAQLSKQKYVDEVSTVRKFMISNKMKRRLLNRLNLYMESQWEISEGIKVKHLMFDIPKYFYEKLNKDRYYYMLESIPLFKLFSRAMIRMICGKCEIELFPPNEYVTYAGDTTQNMYIIEKGFCEMLFSGSNRADKIVGPMTDFCVIDMLLEVPVLYNIRTLTNVSVLKISLADIDNVMSYKPELKGNVHNLIAMTKNTIAVKRLFMKSGETWNVPYVKRVQQGSFFRFPNGKLHPLNLDFQRGWRQFTLLRYFMRRKTILPNGPFLYRYAIFHAVIVFAMCTINPCLFVYQCAMKKIYAISISLFLDLLLLIDVYIRLHVCYYNEDGVLVTHPKYTATHYITTSFTVDLLTALPLKLIFEIFLGRTDASYINLIKVLRVYRIPNAFSYCEKDILKNKDIWLSIVKYLILTTIIFNTLTAILILLGCKYTSLDEVIDILTPYNSSWVFTIDTDSELSIKANRNSNAMKIYYLALYYITQASLKLGIGDIAVVQNIEVIYTMLVVIFGYVWFTYILVTISNTKAALNLNLTIYQNHMKDLIIFMKEQRVPKLVQNKNIRFFEYMWQRTQGTNTMDIFDNFHTTLKGDCVLSMYQDTLALVSIFQNADASFFRALSMLIKEAYYLQDMDICCINNIVDSVYIVHRGVIKVTRPDGHIETNLRRGAMFGNLDNVKHTRCTITCSTNTTVDLLHLKTSKFYNLIEKYPSMARIMDQFIVETNMAYININTTANDIVDDITRDLKIKQQKFKLTKSEIFYMSRTMELISMLGSYFSYLIIIYHASFQHHKPWVIALTFFFDFMQIIKIYITFKTPYISRLGEIVKNKKRIKNKYLKESALYFDLFSLIPFEFFSFAFPTGNIWLYVALFRLNRVVRLISIKRYFGLTYDYLNVNVLAIKLFSLFVFCTTFTHTVTCIWYYVACPNGVCRKASWYYDQIEKQPNCGDPYICSLYYTTSILTTTGYATMVPRSLIGITACIIAMIVSQFIMTIFISDIAAVVRHYGHRLVVYSQQVTVLKIYLINAQISLRLQQKIMNYVDQLWSLSKGRQMPIYMRMGPSCLVEELKVHAFGKHIFNNLLFSGCHDDFLRLLVTHLKMTTYFTGDVIIRQGDINNTMYFIHTGSVDVVFCLEKEEILVDMLDMHDCFGLIQGLFENTPHTHTYQCKSVTTIVSLVHEDWKHLLQFFPASKYLVYSLIRSGKALNEENTL